MFGLWLAGAVSRRHHGFAVGLLFLHLPCGGVGSVPSVSGVGAFVGACAASGGRVAGVVTSVSVVAAASGARGLSSGGAGGVGGAAGVGAAACVACVAVVGGLAAGGAAGRGGRVSGGAGGLTVAPLPPPCAAHAAQPNKEAFPTNVLDDLPNSIVFPLCSAYKFSGSRLSPVAAFPTESSFRDLLVVRQIDRNDH